MEAYNKSIGPNLQRIMAEKKITAKDLAVKVGVSSTHLSYVINNKRQPSFELLNSLSAALNVSVDRLTGEAASSIIEERLKELKITLEEVAQKTNVPLYWLQNLDTFIPGEFGDYEIGYDWITKVAEVLRLPSSTLRAALARQEIPGYEVPVLTAEEAFGNENFSIINKFKPVRVTSKIVRIPLLGKIPAGEPIACEESIIDYIEVSEKEVKNGDYFYLKVEGDSMIGSGIMSGYNVLVRKQPDVENGEIAIVRVNNSEATLKRVKKIDGQTILYPDNPKYEPIIISNKEAKIIGKVVKVEFYPNRKF